jgi:hypothetical protein
MATGLFNGLHDKSVQGRRRCVTVRVENVVNTTQEAVTNIPKLCTASNSTDCGFNKYSMNYGS